MPNVVCYGEVLLRLTAPQNGALLQFPTLAVNVGGAEANVAVSLSRFGYPVSLVSVLPDNALGHAALGELRRHGVHTDGIRFGAGRTHGNRDGVRNQTAELEQGRLSTVAFHGMPGG